MWVGIDPGADGALAILENPSVLPLIVPFNEQDYIIELSKLAERKNYVRVCLEKVGAMPGQGVVSTFNFGRNFGFIEGILQSFELPYQLVPPQKWKKEFSVTSDKKTSIEVCKRLFPGISLLRNDRCRADHDGMAEAALMAEYSRRRL